MSTQRYSVTPHWIESFLTRVKSGEIAIPEIQRAFVWGATKVHKLLERMNCIADSMLDGEAKEYEASLNERRKLMALKIKTWFEALR